MRYQATLTVGVVFLCWGTASAGEPADELRGLFAAATRILEDPELDGKGDERFRAIRAISREMFDFPEAARTALGPGWDDRTLAERERFVWLFSHLLERSFITWIAGRTQIADGLRVTFVGESQDGHVASVRTTMVGKNGDDLSFDYRMVQRGGRWLVRDVTIDGMSLTANYRAQFARVIQASSYPDLVRQMQELSPAPPVVAMAAAKESADPVELPPALVPETLVKAPGPAAVTTPYPEVRQEVRQSVTVAWPAPRHVPEALAGPSPSPPVPAAPPATRREPPSRPAEPHVAAAPTARVGASVRRSYWVQVAAFKSIEAALRLATALQSATPSVSDRWVVVMEPGLEGPTLARVRVGPFPDRTAATTSARDLETRGYKPFIAEERN